MQLYRNCYHEIAFDGCTFGGFTVLFGITQGCCLSAAVFAICMDICLPALLFFFPSSISPRALFDDLGIIYYNASANAEGVMDLFSIFRLASGLQLDLTKGIILRLWSQLDLRNAAFHQQVHSLFPHFTIKLAARYLGILLGPSAWKNPWALTLTDDRIAIAVICSFGLGINCS
jgi:hypothetical protein